MKEISTNYSLLANYREANRAPSPVELACADPAAPCRLPNAFVADPPLEQVITRSVETGIRGKSNFNKFTINFTSVGFLSKNYDDIIFVSSGTGLSSGYFKNFGETQRLGIDFTIDAFNNKKKNRSQRFFNKLFLPRSLISISTHVASS